MNEYVLHDDHALGYLQRELEMLLGGVGELAESAIGVRKSAGAGGGKASSDKKNQRLFEFLEEFEKLGELLGKFTEQRLLDQAFENCVEKSPALWRQGKGQQEEYETILRSNPEFKERYFRVLGETT